MYLNYGAIEAFDCERVAIVLPSQAYEEGQYPKAIVAHHAAGLNATPVRFGVTYVAKSECDLLKDENAKLREYAYALEECRREAHYCEFCPHFHRDFEDENPYCDFNFDALRAAAGMEVS